MSHVGSATAAGGQQGHQVTTGSKVAPALGVLAALAWIGTGVGSALGGVYHYDFKAVLIPGGVVSSVTTIFWWRQRTKEKQEAPQTQPLVEGPQGLAMEPAKASTNTEFVEWFNSLSEPVKNAVGGNAILDRYSVDECIYRFQVATRRDKGTGSHAADERFTMNITFLEDAGIVEQAKKFLSTQPARQSV
jgi:hypothetical protein